MSQSKENKVIIDGIPYYGGLNQPNLKFIKVNVDCWETIFGLLSLQDILSMSQTCLRMRQIGGHYFRENFHGTPCKLKGTPTDLHISVGGKPIERMDFLRFVDTIVIQSQPELTNLRNILSTNLLQSVTTLSLQHMHLNGQLLHGLENIQSNVETIELHNCNNIDSSVAEFLASCQKLKCLRLNYVNFGITTAAAYLFQRIFPKLEYFEYFNSGDTDPPKMSFLEQNPNIKCLRMSSDNLRGMPLDITTIQLDYLNIDIHEASTANTILNQLKTLHANGFYKKLRVTIEYTPDGFDGEMFFREMASFDALEVLKVHSFFINALRHLIQLKELYLWSLGNDMDLESMAMNLVNIERLSISGTINQLSPFLRYSKKLKYVLFYDMHGSNALSLSELNKVRKMCGERHKVRIGIYENQYSDIKWSQSNVDFNFVEITREKAIRKHFHF